MTLPKASVTLIKLFSALLLAGILLANSLLAAFAVIPLLFAALGLFLKVPGGVAIERSCDKERISAGEDVQITLDLRIESGYGPVLVSEFLPSHFKVAAGSNFHLIWKGFGEFRTQLTYTVRCTTSGTYTLGEVHWEANHWLFRHTRAGSCRLESVLEVRPRILEARKIRNAAQLSRIPMPMGAVAKNGLSTMEFKEIRRYTPGDPFRYINWKATSRNIRGGSVWPVVNEFDKEGKKSVWLFMDGSKDMELGTNLRNAFECGLEAVGGLADYYLREQCFVSFCTYGGPDVFVYPGTGKKQGQRIVKELIRLNTLKATHSDYARRNPTRLREVLIRHRGYFKGARPLFVIITRCQKDNSQQLLEAVEEMTRYTVSGGRDAQIMVVNIRAYQLAAQSDAEILASEVLNMRDNAFLSGIRKKCAWVDWDPTRHSFSHALLRQGVKA